MDQGLIQMFKAHYLQKMWVPLVWSVTCLWTNLRRLLKLLRRLGCNSKRTWCGAIGRSTLFVMRFGKCGMPGRRCGALHLWGLEKVLSRVRRRHKMLRPVREAFEGAPQLPWVGKEGWPGQTWGRRHWLFAGDDRQGTVDRGPRQTGEAAALVRGGGWNSAAACGTIDDKAADGEGPAALLRDSEPGDGPPGGDGHWFWAGRTNEA